MENESKGTQIFFYQINFPSEKIVNKLEAKKILDHNNGDIVFDHSKVKEILCCQHC